MFYWWVTLKFKFQTKHCLLYLFITSKFFSQCSMDWFLYDNGRRLERVNLTALNSLLLDLTYAPIDIMSKGFILSPRKKVVLFPEIGWVKIFSSITRPHRWICLRIYIFRFKQRKTLTCTEIKSKRN